MRRSLTVLAASALISAPVAAEMGEWVQTDEATAARLIEAGIWEFSSTRHGSDGKPECHESWTFNSDGTGLIISGAQRVTTRWMVTRYAGIGQFVFITNLTTTEGPDCLGHAVDMSQYPWGQAGFQLLFYADGAGALVCREGDQVVRTDGSTLNALDPEDCWGRIVPAARN